MAAVISLKEIDKEKDEGDFILVKHDFPDLGLDGDKGAVAFRDDQIVNGAEFLDAINSLDGSFFGIGGKRQFLARLSEGEASENREKERENKEIDEDFLQLGVLLLGDQVGQTVDNEARRGLVGFGEMFINIRD